MTWKFIFRIIIVCYINPIKSKELSELYNYIIDILEITPSPDPYEVFL